MLRYLEFSHCTCPHRNTGQRTVYEFHASGFLTPSLGQEWRNGPSQFAHNYKVSNKTEEDVEVQRDIILMTQHEGSKSLLLRERTKSGNRYLK
jgi:hypothetical protein